MIISMNEKEFDNLKTFLKSLDSREVIEEYNNIFDSSNHHGNSLGIKGRRNPVKDDEIFVTIPDEVSIKLLKALSKNGKTIGNIFKADISITKIPKIIGSMKGIMDDIINIFNK